VLQITPAERMVPQLLAQGRPPLETADRIGLRTSDIGEYLAALFAKMRASDTSEAISDALRGGLLPGSCASCKARAVLGLNGLTRLAESAGLPPATPETPP
jgi:DNA-binding CsgD family transcriptional regulator